MLTSLGRENPDTPPFGTTSALEAFRRWLRCVDSDHDFGKSTMHQRHHKLVPLVLEPITGGRGITEISRVKLTCLTTV